MDTLEILSEARCFGGVQGVYRHASTSTGTPMQLSVYVPPQAAAGPCPVVYFLSGLTCTEANFTTKAGAQRYAAEHGLVVVAPDTSPRGDGVADEEDWDIGQGASFYVDAERAPWAPHYRMFSYVADELPALIAARFPVDPDRQGISGHSMGGHGALVVALRRPDRFKSISAFAPIAAPTECPWGHKAFSRYLGPDRATWGAWDAARLIEARGCSRDILVDQGDADTFLKAQQLRPDRLAEACAAAGVPLRLRMQPGYDHSYYFVASFIGDHLAWHAERL